MLGLGLNTLFNMMQSELDDDNARMILELFEITFEVVMEGNVRSKSLRRLHKDVLDVRFTA